jgi:hypothetical protein
MPIHEWIAVFFFAVAFLSFILIIVLDEPLASPESWLVFFCLIILFWQSYDVLATYLFGK